jgi:hypothetical protein
VFSETHVWYPINRHAVSTPNAYFMSSDGVKKKKNRPIASNAKVVRATRDKPECIPTTAPRTLHLQSLDCNRYRRRSERDTKVKDVRSFVSLLHSYYFASSELSWAELSGVSMLLGCAGFGSTDAFLDTNIDPGHQRVTWRKRSADPPKNKTK